MTDGISDHQKKMDTLSISVEFVDDEKEMLLGTKYFKVKPAPEKLQ